MNLEMLDKAVRLVPDFPKTGILFLAYRFIMPSTTKIIGAESDTSPLLPYRGGLFIETNCTGF